VVKQTPAGFEGHQQVDIAVVVAVAAGNRTEHAYIAGAVFGGNPENVVSFQPKLVYGVDGSASSRGRMVAS